jgi:hypothetical protein
MGKDENTGDQTTADLYPELSEGEREDAEYRLKKYLRIVRPIYDRYEAEGRLDELLKMIRKERRQRRAK